MVDINLYIEIKRTIKLEWGVEGEDEKDTRIDDVDVDVDAEPKYSCIFNVTYTQT